MMTIGLTALLELVLASPCFVCPGGRLNFFSFFFLVWLEQFSEFGEEERGMGPNQTLVNSESYSPFSVIFLFPSSKLWKF